MITLKQKSAATAHSELQDALSLLVTLVDSLDDRNIHKPNSETIRATMNNAIDNHLSEVNEWLTALKSEG